MSLLARCCIVLAGAACVGALSVSGKAGVPGGPEEAALMVYDEMDERFEVEQPEGGGILIGKVNKTLGREPGSTSLLTQLSVPIAALAAGGGVYILLPKYKTLAQLLLFFGAQTFMNIYLKSILSHHVVSTELNMKGFRAPLVLTAFQQIVGFVILSAGILVSQLTPWAYRPRPLQGSREVIAVLVLAVCFTLNIALNNYSLSLLDMSVNMMIRSASPLTSLILQLMFKRWFEDAHADINPPKVCLMLSGIFFALLVVVSKQSPGATGQSYTGLALCVISLFFSSMELIVVVILGNGFKLNPVDTLLYMALPVFILLLLPCLFITHPVGYPGHANATDWSVLLEVARLSPGTVVLVMLSGIWALAYNLLLYNIVKGLSPYFASFAANCNKIMAIGLALLIGLESLPQGGWKIPMVVGVLGNMTSFTAYSLWPNNKPSESKTKKGEAFLESKRHLEKAMDAEAPLAKKSGTAGLNGSLPGDSFQDSPKSETVARARQGSTEYREMMKAQGHAEICLTREELAKPMTFLWLIFKGYPYGLCHTMNFVGATGEDPGETELNLTKPLDCEWFALKGDPLQKEPVVTGDEEDAEINLTSGTARRVASCKDMFDLTKGDAATERFQYVVDFFDNGCAMQIRLNIISGQKLVFLIPIRDKAGGPLYRKKDYVSGKVVVTSMFLEEDTHKKRKAQGFCDRRLTHTWVDMDWYFGAPNPLSIKLSVKANKDLIWGAAQK